MKPTAFFFCAMLAISAPAAAELNILKSFAKDGAKLEVVLFTQGDKMSGIIGTVGAKRLSYGMGADTIGTFMSLLQKIVKTDPPVWHLPVTMTETDTKNPSHIVIYAGPVVKFFVMDPSIGVNTFDLSWDEFEMFKTAVADLNGRLTAPKK